MGALPYTLSFPSLGCVVVHAGLVPGVELHDQDAEAMSCMRNVVEIEGGGGFEPRTHPTQGAGSQGSERTDWFPCFWNFVHHPVDNPFDIEYHIIYSLGSIYIYLFYYYHISHVYYIYFNRV